MNYPSMFILPLPMTVFSILHRFKGPKITLQISEKLAKLLCSKRHPCRINFEPDDLQFELKCLNKLMPKPYIACLEQACALQLWLAWHGQTTRLCIGKRIENGQLLMHAWLESTPEPFFYDSRFQEICITSSEDAQWKR